MSKAKVKRIFANLSLLLVFFSFAFLAGEVVVRMLFKDSVVMFPRYHTDVQYGEFTLRRIRPNSSFWHTSVDGSWEFETNAQGFRNRIEFDYEKPEDVIRVLSLGDSHTQGYEVRQDFTFSAVIEKYLNASGYEAQVLNTGVSGFSTAEELVLLENEGVKFQPDFVVLGFYANDFEDNLKAGLFRLTEDGTLSIEKKQHIPGVRVQNLIYSVPTVAWLSENSYFYSIFFNSVWQFFKDKLATDAADATAEYAVPTTDRNSTYEIELTIALLTRLKEFCSERGIPLIIVDIPRLSQDPSLPPAIQQIIPDLSDAYIDGAALLERFADVAEVHRPAGNRHITEFSHIVLGVNAAEQIAAWLGEENHGVSSPN
ncbi:MAG: hypothetical protein OEU36_25635 [Gammaproteobacteria bacterium]|nr:hypothetical protein [Gammaproteobacteria bacterium]